MDNKNDRFDNIVYDEQWHSISQPEYPDISVNDENDLQDDSDNYKKYIPKHQKEKKKSPKQWLIIIQLILCILVFIGVYILRELGGDLYKTVINWYETELNNSMIIDNTISDIQLEQFLSGVATDDQS